MNDLKEFQKFGKKNEQRKNHVKEVWCYTRVSSIDQKNNYSLNNQLEAAEKYAKENGYDLVKNFGGTYESGKDDFTRKEFSRLLEEVKKSRKKPFAIIVYKMNRFSRSGGKSIALANELVYKQGVHLIEIVSGIDTTTRKGQNELNKRLLAAQEENINKLEHTIPGLKSFLRAGNWLGVAPEGYDHEGTRVNDFNKRATIQRISLNETGRILKMA
jgi:DNA invertase Pin-like site-specific DNA recombinase